MCVLDRRLQLLLDDARYRRVAARARRENKSVSAVIRDAIDVALPADLAKRKSAWRRIASADAMPVPEPAELKRELDEARARGR